MQYYNKISLFYDINNDVYDNEHHSYNIQDGAQDNIHHLIQENNESLQDSKANDAISLSHS